MRVRAKTLRTWLAAGGVTLGLAAFSAATLVRADEYVDVPQGWSTSQKANWYTLSQGSRLIPLSWLRALEQPGNGQPFLDAAHVAKFGYLPHASAGAGRLPVGFAIDTQSDRNLSNTKLRWKQQQSDREAWVGMNCAACHTAEITYRGKRMRIEGGPTLADFQGFMETLNRALVETRDNPEKWSRFAGAVLAGADTSTNRAMLKSELGKLIEWQLKVEIANATPLRYGFARLDAFGHIFNKVLLLTDAEGEQSKNPSDAPVSYPFLWNIHQFDKVQWNGIAPNIPLNPSFDLGALGRNTGEVIGVFADVKLKRVPQVSGYTSSADIRNLDLLEQQLASLKPPAWPEQVLGTIDQPKREAGEALFKDHCASCHAHLKRDDLQTPIETTMTPLKGPRAAGTDVWMACNAYTYEARTGLLQLTLRKYFLGVPFGETASLADLLGATVAGVLWSKRQNVIHDFSQSIRTVAFFGQQPGVVLTLDIPIEFQLPELVRPVRDPGKQARFKRCGTESSPILAYKARPLTGIWATAPYLHNGSVPTLYDLLLPPDERPRSFHVGSREFDPKNVGYVATQSGDGDFLFSTRDADGRVIDGNSNLGHDYGNASFSDDQRRALVEYMKGL